MVDPVHPTGCCLQRAGTSLPQQCRDVFELVKSDQTGARVGADAAPIEQILTVPLRKRALREVDWRPRIYGVRVSEQRLATKVDVRADVPAPYRCEVFEHGFRPPVRPPEHRIQMLAQNLGRGVLLRQSRQRRGQRPMQSHRVARAGIAASARRRCTGLRPPNRRLHKRRAYLTRTRTGTAGTVQIASAIPSADHVLSDASEDRRKSRVSCRCIGLVKPPPACPPAGFPRPAFQGSSKESSLRSP